ncbi:MAG: hypothetical protein AB7W28_10255 [Armatimonadota bacterium]
MTPQGPAQSIYLIAFLALWILLVWRDVQRAQQIAAFYTRTRQPLVAASLVGTVVEAVGISVLIIGVYLGLTSEQTFGLSVPARRTVVLGGILLMLGWAVRLVAWTLWKRRNPKQLE